MDVMPLPEFKFHEVKGYNRYCGPTALATLLGITTDEAAKRIRQNSPRRKMVKSCHVSEVLKVLRQAGWQVVKMPPYVRTTTTLRQAHKRTLSGWLYVCSKQKTPAGFFGNRTRISSLHFLVPPTPIAVQINFPEEGPAELEELFRV
jgi:hypothetical protein